MLLILLAIVVALSVILLYLKPLYQSLCKIEVVEEVRGADGKKTQSVRSYEQAPGPPYIWPILGNLVDLGKYAVPTIGFNELAKKYGEIYSMTLGSTRCVVISNLDIIMEILNKYGNETDARPDFIRFHKLFGGDREQSLALCDWSELHKRRRFLSRKHCAPGENSPQYDRMGDVGYNEMPVLLKRLEDCITPGKDYHIKPLISQTCLNIFTQYMCSVRFDYDDAEFQKVVRIYDDIIWEINNGSALDFLPWLQPFFKKHLNRISSWQTELDHFIAERLIGNREAELQSNGIEKDFTDYLVKNMETESQFDENTNIYILGDFIGGSAALANFVMQILGYIALNPKVGDRIQIEIDKVSFNGTRRIAYSDEFNMPYTVSTIYESLRYTSSPIVPHVCTKDIAVSGYGIASGTIIFLNNYSLNRENKYWSQPEQFKPERFLMHVPALKARRARIVRRLSRTISKQLSFDSGRGIYCDDSIDMHIDKNESCQVDILSNQSLPQFLPFSTGKRTCLGRYLLECYSFIIITNILQKYNLSVSNENLIKIPIGSLAIQNERIPLTLTPRHKEK